MMTTMSRRNRPTAGRKNVARVRQGAQSAARRIRRLLTAAFAALLFAVSQATHTFAQGGGGDGGTGAFGSKITSLTTNLTTLGRPLAGLSLVIGILITIFEPMLPDMARENKGMIRKVLVGCMVLGLIPDLLGFVFA
jgi:hypothetical protein